MKKLINLIAKVAYSLMGGRPMRYVAYSFVDIVSSRPIFLFKDKFDRYWNAYGKWSLFRVRATYENNDYMLITRLCRELSKIECPFTGDTIEFRHAKITSITDGYDALRIYYLCRDCNPDRIGAYCTSMQRWRDLEYNSILTAMANTMTNCCRIKANEKRLSLCNDNGGLNG